MDGCQYTIVRGEYRGMRCGQPVVADQEHCASHSFLQNKLNIDGCQYMIVLGEYRGLRCNQPVVANHENCLFHSSLKERENLDIPFRHWALFIRPTLEESTYRIDNFPSDQYEEEYSGYEYNDDVNSNLCVPYKQFQTADGLCQMPTDSCRFLFTEGKDRGYYCGCPNEAQSDFCTFHGSIKRDTSYNPVPIWTRAIRPTEADSQKKLAQFPWRNYDIADLLFFDIASEQGTTTKSARSQRSSSIQIPSIPTQPPMIPSIPTQPPMIPSIPTQPPMIPSIPTQPPMIPLIPLKH